MGTEDEKGFKFDIPIVADRREFFEQEAVVSGPPGVLKSDLEPDEVARSLKQMRESAGRRTGSAQPGALASIRAAIDEVDAELTDLLARRQRMVEEAGHLKSTADEVRDPDRVAKVIAKARERALAAGASPEVAEAVWTAMVAAFIDLELEELPPE